MSTYRIERPVKWNGEIRKSGTIETESEQAVALVKSGALVEVDPETAAQVPLEQLKVGDLRDVAVTLKIDGAAAMKKADLVVAVKAAQAKANA